MKLFFSLIITSIEFFIIIIITPELYRVFLVEWSRSPCIALDSREFTVEKTQVSPTLYEIVTLSELVK